MAKLRDAVEIIIQQRHGVPLITYLMNERNAKVSLRKIAANIYDNTGVLVSHQTVADWIREG